MFFAQLPSEPLLLHNTCPESSHKQLTSQVAMATPQRPLLSQVPKYSERQRKQLSGKLQVQVKEEIYNLQGLLLQEHGCTNGLTRPPGGLSKVQGLES